MNIPSKIIGHSETFNNLVDLYKKNNLPSKILLTGHKGIGKSLFINLFLKFVFSLNDVNSNIDNIIENNSHPNIFKINKNIDKNNIDINQIRKMIHFQNLSSFNNMNKFIIIEDIENLNINSANALLKSLEEPNKNLFFLLTYNLGGKIPDTIKSRCLEFKMSLSIDEVKIIVNNYFNYNIYELISKDFVNHYNSPSFYIFLLKFFNEIKIEPNNFYIEDLLNEIIKNKHYKKNIFIKENLFFFIELFFYKNINKSKKITYNIKNYFYSKISDINKYNLDLETFFLEFDDKLLSE